MSADTYVYQPEVAISEYDRAVDVLRQRVANPLVRDWLPPISTEIASEVTAQMLALGIRVEHLDADPAGYRRYMDSAQYGVRHPAYYTNNLTEKSFEHFVALRLLELTNESVFVDVASEHSALPEIASRTTGATCYSQDIMYPDGVHGSKIGGDACCMPVPSGFATAAALTCSLEHFEGDADTRLFQGLGRVLRAGGRICIVPLYMYTSPVIMTDPTYSASCNVPFDTGATIYCCQDMKNRHGRFYSPDTLWKRIIEPNAGTYQFRVFQILGSKLIDPTIYAHFALLAERR